MVRSHKFLLINFFFVAILSYSSIIFAQNLAPLPNRDTTANIQQPIGKKIKPTLVLVRSAIVPGWGQFYNKQYIKAIIFAAGEGYLIYGISQDWKKTDRYYSSFRALSNPSFAHAAAITSPNRSGSAYYDAPIPSSEIDIRFKNYTKYRDRRNLKMWILGASIFYSMFDAYVDAQLSDFNQTDKSYEAFIAPTSDGGVQVGLTFNLK